MEIPNFLKLEDNSLIFNLDNKELIFYIPEEYFVDNTKTPIAEIFGEDVSTIGLFNWSIINSDGSNTGLKPFTFPTMILCSPYNIEKVKDFTLPGMKADSKGNYRLLHFKKGDKVIKQTRVPKLIDNAEMFFKLVMITAKFPTSISYEKIWELFIYNADLNGFSYNLHSQLFGIMAGTIARSTKDPAIPYRLSGSKDPHDYNMISIKMIPKFLSPFTSIVSENFDDALRSAVLLSEKPDDELPTSPLEKVVMQ